MLLLPSLFMVFHSYKAKQYLLIALKVFILGITFWYVYEKLTSNDSLDLRAFWLQIQQKEGSILSILFFLFLAIANWFFEFLKWKSVVSEVQKISFSTSIKQSLYALTVSLATPNRIGDYGAKAYFYTSEKRKQILLLNFFSNAVQMGVTTLLGIFGLVYVVQKFGVSFSSKISGSKITLVSLLFVLLIVLGFIFKEQQLVVKGLSISKVIKKIRGLQFWVKSKVIIYSVTRYFIFSFLFFCLLNFFGADITPRNAFPIIFAMYLLVSITPTIFIFDVVIRGGVAVWLFSLAGIPELPVLCTVLTMWILNFVLPSILGSYYMFRYKPEFS